MRGIWLRQCMEMKVQITAYRQQAPPPITTSRHWMSEQNTAQTSNSTQSIEFWFQRISGMGWQLVRKYLPSTPRIVFGQAGSDPTGSRTPETSGAELRHWNLKDILWYVVHFYATFESQNENKQFWSISNMVISAADGWVAVFDFGSGRT